MKGIKVADLPETIKRLNPSLCVPGKAADVEQTPGHAPLAKEKASRLDGPTRLVITEYRHRLTDDCGGSHKYLVDAIVSAGVLEDDSLKFVKKIEHEQVRVDKTQSERTVVEIWDASH